MSTHYVAQLKIERVDKVEPPRSGGYGGGSGPVPTDSKRDISEVTQLTIKGNTLDALIEKLGKHIQIIEEG